MNYLRGEESKIKIKQATIYGFGKWIDYSVDFSEENFICVYGENESGKSTLQNFILFILFGLPPKQREFYRPKTSGKMGGRLTIIDPVIGEYTIERLDEVKKGAARCYASDGQEYDEEWLKDRLQGMTKDIYQSVYSFSALDLNEFKRMKDEDIGEVLLGIGLTGSNNIYHIERQLDQKIGELFKPTGKNPTINQQLESLNGLFEEVTNYKNNESTYHDKQEQQHTILSEIEYLQIKLQEEKETKQTIERFLYYLPVINDYHRYLNEIKDYPNKIDFPENGVELLNKLKEKLLPLQSELSILKVNQTNYEAEQAKLKEQQLAEDIYEEAQMILSQKDNYNEHNKELQSSEARLKAINIKLEAELGKLNVGLTYAQLIDVSLPFYIEEEWNELRNEMDRLTFEKEQLLQEQAGLDKQQIFLSNQSADIEQDLLTPEQLEDTYSQIDAYKEFDYRNKLKDESSAKQLKWEKEKSQKEKRIASLLIGSLVIGLLSGGIGFLLDIPFMYNLMTIVVILGIGQWIFGKKGIKETDYLLGDHDRLEDVSVNITEIQKQDAEQALMKDDENRSTLSSLKDQLKSIDVQFIQLEEKKNRVSQRESKLTTQINTQLEKYPFLNKIEIKYWPEFHRTLKELLKMLQEEQTFQQQIKSINGKIDSYSDVLAKFLKKINPSLVEQSLNFQIKIIEDMILKYKESEQSIKRYIKEITENMNLQAETRQKMEVYEREMDKLFTIAQVDSEDEFYKKDNLRLEKQEVKEKLQQTSDQLQASFSQSIWIDISQNKPDQSKLEVEEQEISEEIQEIEKDIHERRQRLADLNADLKQMESSEIYSQTMHQYTMEKEKLAKLAKEWAVLKTAKEMLVETKRKYRDKYLTDVIARTSVYFKKLTMNTYESVIPPQAGKPFQVETADQMRYQVSELSQGTIDQLYVCLRLAISEIMSEEHHFPFIIDDAFVHFDSPRTEQIIEILTEIGKRQQIILFTCKQGLAQSIPDPNMIHLKKNV